MNTLERREYDKAYREKNRESIRERYRRWCQENAEKIRERAATWRKENADASRGYSKKWREENKAYYQEWANDNVDKLREKYKRYAKEHPEYTIAKKQRYRTRKVNNGGSFTASEWKDLVSKCEGKCLCCKEKKPLAADHVVPLARGGTNSIDNIQPLCKSCNSKKGTKTIDYRI